jgi:hypothetical protein
MSKDIPRDANNLFLANCWQPSLLKNILDSFVLAGGDGNKDFRYDLRVLKTELKKALGETGPYMTTPQTMQHLAMKQFTYKVIKIYFQ